MTNNGEAGRRSTNPSPPPSAVAAKAVLEAARRLHVRGDAEGRDEMMDHADVLLSEIAELPQPYSRWRC